MRIRGTGKGEGEKEQPFPDPVTTNLMLQQNQQAMSVRSDLNTWVVTSGLGR
jgi:hypothetical protein